jgi:uncharacterized OB-fold protein
MVSPRCKDCGKPVNPAAGMCANCGRLITIEEEKGS